MASQSSVEPVSLAPRFSGALPPLAHDWAEEVRASPDRLGAVLPTWSGPLPESPADRSPGASAHEGVTQQAPPVRLLVDGDGLEAMPQVLSALMSGGGIVGPAAQVDPRQAADRGD